MRACIHVVLALSLFACFGACNQDAGSADHRAFDLRDADAVLLGENHDDHAGASVCAAGDVNGDGLNDVLVGAPYFDGAENAVGAAYLVLSPTAGIQSLSGSDAKLVGSVSGGLAAYSVSIAGDTNSDGLDDILIGAPGVDAAYLFHGPVQGELDCQAADAVFTNQGGPNYLGSSVVIAGDVNGDGNDDLLIGAPGEIFFYGPGGSCGGVYLVLGPVEGESTVQDAAIELLGDWPDTGFSVASAGDVNADGFSDLLVGTGSSYSAYWHEVLEGCRTYLLLGSAEGVSPLQDADATLQLDSFHYAYSAECNVAGAGDLDGDGYDDLLVGVDFGQYDEYGYGEVMAFLGPVSGEMALEDGDIVLTGGDPCDRTGVSFSGLGHSVASADVDGNGHPDLLSGAECGEVYLWKNPTLDTVGGSDADRVLANPEAEYPKAFLTSGDITGDGKDEIVIGDYAWGHGAGVVYVVSGDRL